jgi:hypothetical protein
MTQISGNRLRACVRLLSKARSLPHGNRTLFDHLWGTWRILASSNADSDIAVAGLVHSIYATEHYPFETYSQASRLYVTKHIGASAERLAYLFCVLEKQVLWDTLRDEFPMPRSRSMPTATCQADEIVTPDEAASLLQIECANFAEQTCQLDGSPAPFLAWYVDLARRGYVKEPFLNLLETPNDEEETASIVFYNQFLVDTHAGFDSDAIDRALQLNRGAPEIILLSALRAASTGKDLQDVSARIRHAKSTLLGWGTPWDKRMTFREWVRIVNALISSPASRPLAIKTLSDVARGLLAKRVSALT